MRKTKHVQQHAHFRNRPKTKPLHHADWSTCCLATGLVTSPNNAMRFVMESKATGLAECHIYTVYIHQLQMGTWLWVFSARAAK